MTSGIALTVSCQIDLLVLQENGGNVSAADALAISRNTIYRNCRR